MVIVIRLLEYDFEEIWEDGPKTRAYWPTTGVGSPAVFAIETFWLLTRDVIL